MARQQKQKPLRAGIDPPVKKVKTRSEIEREAWESREYPPEFYDRLTKIPLSHGALRELNRRTHPRRSHPSPPVGPSASIGTATAQYLTRFARHGGPDLRDLWGVSLYMLSLEIVVLTSPSSITTRRPIIHIPLPRARADLRKARRPSPQIQLQPFRPQRWGKTRSWHPATPDSGSI
jgi:hypothetical protein